jgi:hypothetical protein
MEHLSVNALLELVQAAKPRGLEYEVLQSVWGHMEEHPADSLLDACKAAFWEWDL